jgi:anthranilate 1,2-dioxygenase small subunit
MTAEALPLEMFLRLTMLFEEYGRLLDEDRLEEWTDLFVEDCLYEIVSRENVRQNLPLSLMLCDSKDMLRDRISALRQANIFNIHTDCHIIGPVHSMVVDESWQASSAYALYQSTQEGETRLFSVGRYHAHVVEQDGLLRFARQRVVVDTGTILTLLATPI